MPQFDPCLIPKFSVIRLPYLFEGSREAEPKLFVVLCHKDGHAFCLKATSKVALFKNNPSMMKGCVWFDANQVVCFSVSTVVDPANQFAVSHKSIRRAQLEGKLEISELPASFKADLMLAINNSVNLSQRERDRLLGVISL